MSVIFFCADFSTFSYLKLASDSFGGVHKQYGPKRERGRLFYPMHLMTWFIVNDRSSSIGNELKNFFKRKEYNTRNNILLYVLFLFSI